MMAEDKKEKKDLHDGEQNEDSQAEQLMDEQYEFGLNEDVREKIEQEDSDHKEPDNKANKDDVVVNEDEVQDETDK